MTTCTNHNSIQKYQDINPSASGYMRMPNYDDINDSLSELSPRGRQNVITIGALVGNAATGAQGE